MLYSYIIAWANKHNCIAMNQSFIEYSTYFPYFTNNPLGLLPIKYNLFSYILKQLNDVFQNSLKRISLRSYLFPYLYKIDLENVLTNTQNINFPKILSAKKIIFFYGFLFGDRDFNFIQNNRNYLKNIFTFRENIQKQCFQIIEGFNKNKIIGICMRQGDYKDHFNGKLFLTDEEYTALVSRLQLQYPDHGIFIACEEKKDEFQINRAFISFENPALNLCMLSKCDLLIGPPSTFMTWAAFYKNTAVCYIDKNTCKQQHFTFAPVTF